MVKTSSENYAVLDCYVLHDQPMTCGKCGARTSFEESVDCVQLHQCLNMGCGYKFIAMDDDN